LRRTDPELARERGLLFEPPPRRAIDRVVDRADRRGAQREVRTSHARATIRHELGAIDREPEQARGLVRDPSRRGTSARRLRGERVDPGADLAVARDLGERHAERVEIGGRRRRLAGANLRREVVDRPADGALIVDVAREVEIDQRPAISADDDVRRLHVSVTDAKRMELVEPASDAVRDDRREARPILRRRDRRRERLTIDPARRDEPRAVGGRPRIEQLGPPSSSEPREEGPFPSEPFVVPGRDLQRDDRPVRLPNRAMNDAGAPGSDLHEIAVARQRRCQLRWRSTRHSPIKAEIRLASTPVADTLRFMKRTPLLLCVLFGIPGCDDKKPDPPPAASSASAAPVTSVAAIASSSATATAKDAPPPDTSPFTIVMGKGSFLIDAPLEKIKGASDETRGKLYVGTKDLTKSRGKIMVRLSTLKTATFGDMDKDAAQTEHARNWMEVGPESTSDARMKHEWATLDIKSVDAPPSALAEAKEENGVRTVKAKVSGDLTVHGVTSAKTVPVTLRFKGPAEAPTELVIKTDEPMAVSLKEHDVKPRDKVGSFLNGALDRIGKKIDDKVQVSFEATAKPAMPEHP
jgi:hypothetical protein